MLVLSLITRTQWTFFNRAWEGYNNRIYCSKVSLAPEVKPGHMIFAPLSTNLMAPLSTCWCGRIKGSREEKKYITPINKIKDSTEKGKWHEQIFPEIIVLWQMRNKTETHSFTYQIGVYFLRKVIPSAKNVQRLGIRIYSWRLINRYRLSLGLLGNMYSLALKRFKLFDLILGPYPKK